MNLLIINMAEIERLQKIIAGFGLTSRRKAEQLIEDGKVTVNGSLAHLGDKADPEKDSIIVDGKQISGSKKNRYYILYKPRGYVTTMSDEQGRKCIPDLISSLSERVFPVGRLDLNSEGLLILTNDGDIANKIEHPSNTIKKTYIAEVKPPITTVIADEIKKGVIVDNSMVYPDDIRILINEDAYSRVMITIHEGKNREIRKIFNGLGRDVTRLKRVAIENIKIGNMKPGELKEISFSEINGIFHEKEGKINDTDNTNGGIK
jgi:23S rRNA pseudouridine2605 synthase